MSRRYDGRTTTFSPEGRLYQVEYAMEAISNAGAALGILAKDGVVLAAEKLVTSKLLDPGKTSEKLYLIDEHVACVVSGITADANILVNQARLAAQRYLYTYNEPMPVEQLVRRLCDQKQSYTQFGGLRPFGVSLLYAGYDENYGFQLYQSDPSGNYGGWKASAIGANNQNANSKLKQSYKVDDKEWLAAFDLKKALELAVQVLSKSMDSTNLSAEKLEFATVTRENGAVKFHVLSQAEVDALIKSVKVEVDPE